MTDILISVAALAGLFAVFGLIKPKPACGTDCGLCKNPCHQRKE